MLGRCPISFSCVIYSIIPPSISLSSLFVAGQSNRDFRLETRCLTRPYRLGFLRVASAIKGYSPLRMA